MGDYSGEEIPYRGQVEPKKRKGRFVPSSSAGLPGWAGWSIFIVLGLGFGYFAINDKTGVGLFAFGIYLVCSIMAYFMVRDAKKIKTMTKDEDENES